MRAVAWTVVKLRFFVVAGWIAAGKLKTREDIVIGLETFPETLLKLFKGENFGKQLVKLQ